MPPSPLAKVLVTHPRARLATYFGERALSELRQFADVRLNSSDEDLAGSALVDAARDCTVIIAYRQTPIDAAVLQALPAVHAVVRCAVDLRTIDVAAASGSQQFANEFSSLGHGVFTYVLLKALKGEAANNKMITVNGLKNFLQQGVPALMKKYNGAAQYPASYGMGNDFPVEIIK